MTLVTIRVTKPLNRVVYIDGGYTQPAGNSSKETFTVPTGGHVFETLDGERRVDNRKKFRVRRGDTGLEIELDPVDPPQPI